MHDRADGQAKGGGRRYGKENNLKHRGGGKHLAVSNVEYAEPKLIKDDFYSTYAVFNIKGTIPEILGFVMDYAPTSIELIKTKEIKISPPDLQALLVYKNIEKFHYSGTYEGL